MGRHRRRRGSRASGGQAAQARTQGAQPVEQWASAQEIEDALAALQRAVAIARDLYGTAPYWVDRDELAAHAWDNVEHGVTRLTLPTLLAVGCYGGPHILSGVPQMRLSRDVVEQLAAARVTVEDVRRVEQLRTCLLGVAAQLAARAAQRRSGRYVAEVLPDGTAVIGSGHDGGAVDTGPCAVCQAAEDAWRETISRGQRRRQVERAMHEGRRVFVDYGRGGGMMGMGMPRRG